MLSHRPLHAVAHIASRIPPLVAHLSKGVLVSFFLLAVLSSTDSATAQVPRLLHYQATLVEGEAPPSGPADLSFAFFEDSTGGTPLGGWTEIHSGVELSNGRVNLMLGQHKPLPKQLFDASRLYLQVTVNDNTLPRFPMASTPFALQAAVADSVSSEGVTAEALADETVGASAIAPEAVTSTAIAAGAVTERGLAEGAVTSSVLAPGAVTTEGLAERAVSREKLQTGVVASETLADGAITTSKINDGAVNAEKIEDGQVIKSLNGLSDTVRLVAGDDISIRTDEEEGTITINGNGGIFSSRRWKTDIRPLRKSLSLVQQLQGVRYRWKETGEPDIGLIAEEVGKVVPEVVTYADNGEDAKTVDYARLVAVLIEALKAQQKQLEAERAALQVLERRVEALEQRTRSTDIPDR